MACDDLLRFILRSLRHQIALLQLRHDDRILAQTPESFEGGAHNRLWSSPEFADLLDSVAVADRYGFVFEPLDKKELPVVGEKTVCNVISDIGKALGVVVEFDAETGEPVKYATAHDLRIYFGFCWSQLFMPAVPMTMTRHRKIETTLKF